MVFIRSFSLLVLVTQVRSDPAPAAFYEINAPLNGVESLLAAVVAGAPAEAAGRNVRGSLGKRPDFC